MCVCVEGARAIWHEHQTHKVAVYGAWDRMNGLAHCLHTCGQICWHSRRCDRSVGWSELSGQPAETSSHGEAMSNAITGTITTCTLVCYSTWLHWSINRQQWTWMRVCAQGKTFYRVLLLGMVVIHRSITNRSKARTPDCGPTGTWANFGYEIIINTT